jgi:amidase
VTKVNVPRTLTVQLTMDPSVKDIFKIPKLNGVDMEEISVVDIHNHFSQGTFTSVELVSWTIARINKTNPYLHAVTEINPDVIQIAEKLDTEHKNGRIRGPLHGVPILVKDVCCQLF